MSPRLRHQACRSFGELVPIGEVPVLLANGWRLLDDLGGDPLAATHALLAPPRECEAA
jgi:hypothetical protein